MNEAHPDTRPEMYLEAHFEDLAKQTHAAHLGMWLFLASEVLFFTALFALYVAYRSEYGEAFLLASRHTDLWLGSINTVVLVTASLLVALAVGAIRVGRGRSSAKLLFGAAALGVLFLVLKLTEYFHHFSEGLYPGRFYHSSALPEPGGRVFFTFYYLMTGLHALHVTGGIVLLAVLGILAWKERYSAVYHTPLELGGLYWHLVDLIWLFLWPAFYLLRGGGA